MCPAVTVAVKEKQPFMRLFRSLVKSAPFEQYIRALQTQLKERGVNTEVFKSNLYHQWFVCMWTTGRRKKLQKRAKQHEAAIVLGCDTATETVRDSIKSTACKVVEGMTFAGFMNAKLRFHLPCNVSFEDCRLIPLSQWKKDAVMTD
jgi:hypothetical protein